MTYEFIQKFLDEVRVELEEYADEIYTFLEEGEVGEPGEICAPSGKITFAHLDDSTIEVELELETEEEVIKMSWDNPVTDETSSDDLEYWIADLVRDMCR